MTDHCMGEAGCACHPTPSLYPYGYPLVAASQPGLYSTSPYAAGAGQPCVTLTPNATSLYTTSTAPYDFKESATAWRSAMYPAGYYTYDAAMPYPYGNGYGAINGAAHTKNATKEATSLLKSWLNDHMQNPYPTKGEKIMLAIITKMTLTQVSTWFANARRRLKKENKMTWSPRNRYDDDDDDDKKGDDDDDKSDKEDDRCKRNESLDLSKKGDGNNTDRLDKHQPSSSPDTDPGNDISPSIPNAIATPSGDCEQQRNRLRPCDRSSPVRHTNNRETTPSPVLGGDNNNINSIESNKLLLSDYPLMKPRIWSIAETATSEAMAMRPKAPLYPFISRQTFPPSITSQLATNAARQWPWNQGAFRNTSHF